MSQVLCPARLAALPWLGAARSAVVELSRLLGAVVRVGEVGELAPELAGALVPIVSDLAPVQIGLFSDDPGCDALARVLLGAPADEPLTRPQVVDAVAELVNMLAGQVKARVARYASRAALGLPTFVHGPIEVQRSQAVEALHVGIGAARAWVVVVHAS